MSNEKLNKMMNDPRLAKMANKAGCTPDEMFGRICRTAGIKTSKKIKV